ncbi:MAG: hypothetical protein Aurels2KO_47980 [Aureliella sp.]
MQSHIKDSLTSVRIRHQFSRGIHWASGGLLFGATAGVVILLLQRAEVLTAGGAAWFVVLAASLLGLAIGLLLPTSWKTVAGLVDSTYGLKDRSLAAVEFEESEMSSDLHRLQVADALGHIQKVDPSRVVPFRLPRFAIAAAGSLALMLAIQFVPTAKPEAILMPEALPVVLEQANKLEETMLEELKELAQENDNEELDSLAEDIEEAIEELKQPEVDQRDALAKLSEMQQAVAEAVKRLDVEQIDAQLEQLAEALQATDATKAASQALQSQQYEKAAEELEKIDASTMERKDRKAVKDNLAKLSKKLGDGRKGQLSEAVSEMLEGLEKESDSKCKSGMCKAAGVCKKQAKKKSISQCLSNQLNRLSECKCNCQGQCEGSKPSNKVAKSDSPSSKWGLGASGQPTGENKTKLDSTRRDESLSGVEGDGPSERESTSTPDARQDAARAYSDRYAEYSKKMEEVLDSEPLPLGHRQTVRTYFENIRPNSSDDTFTTPE